MPGIPKIIIEEEKKSRTHKTIIGRKLMSRKWENQDAEMHLSCIVLNQMTKLGMPNSVKAA